jgi:hypothetical protein
MDSRDYILMEDEQVNCIGTIVQYYLPQHGIFRSNQQFLRATGAQ